MKERFDELRRLGIRTVMVTVDNRLTPATMAREHQVTQLVPGQSARNRFRILLKGSVINHILRHAAGVDLYIVADHTSEKGLPRGS